MLEENVSQAGCLINKSMGSFISSLLRILKVYLMQKSSSYSLKFPHCWKDEMRHKDGSVIPLFIEKIIVHRSSCGVSVPRFLIEVNMKSVMSLIHQNLLLPLQTGRKGSGQRQKSLVCFSDS